jgi:hypothetical protein
MKNPAGVSTRGVLLSENDGTRTRNHRTDRTRPEPFRSPTFSGVSEHISLRHHESDCELVCALGARLRPRVR